MAVARAIILAVAFGAAAADRFASLSTVGAGPAHRYIASSSATPTFCNVTNRFVTSLPDTGNSFNRPPIPGNGTCDGGTGGIHTGQFGTSGYSISNFSPSDTASSVTFVINGLVNAACGTAPQSVTFVSFRTPSLRFSIGAHPQGGVALTYASCVNQQYAPLNGGVGVTSVSVFRNFPFSVTGIEASKNMTFTLVVTADAAAGVRVYVNGYQLARRADTPFSDTFGCRYGMPNAWSGLPGNFSILPVGHTCSQFPVTDIQVYPRAFSTVEATTAVSNATAPPASPPPPFPPPATTTPPPAVMGAYAAYTASTTFPPTHRYCGPLPNQTWYGALVDWGSVGGMDGVFAMVSAAAAERIDPAQTFVPLKPGQGIEFGNDAFAAGSTNGTVRVLSMYTGTPAASTTATLTFMVRHYIFQIISTFTSTSQTVFTTSFTVSNAITGATLTKSAVTTLGGASQALSFSVPRYITISYGSLGVYIYENDRIVASFPSIVAPVYTNPYDAFSAVYWQTTGANVMGIQLHDLQYYATSFLPEQIEQLATGISV